VHWFDHPVVVWQPPPLGVHMSAVLLKTRYGMHGTKIACGGTNSSEDWPVNGPIGVWANANDESATTQRTDRMGVLLTDA
jgi:hypothetical protein